jgi:hypothetical protein
LPCALRTRIDETAIIDSTGIFRMEFLRRRCEFITRLGGAAALPAVSRIARAQACVGRAHPARRWGKAAGRDLPQHRRRRPKSSPHLCCGLLFRVTYQRNAAKKTIPSTADPRSHVVGDGRAYHKNPLSANQTTQPRMASGCLILSVNVTTICEYRGTSPRGQTHHHIVVAQEMNSATPNARNINTAAG